MHILLPLLRKAKARSIAVFLSLNPRTLPLVFKNSRENNLGVFPYEGLNILMQLTGQLLVRIMIEKVDPLGT